MRDSECSRGCHGEFCYKPVAKGAGFLSLEAAYGLVVIGLCRQTMEVTIMPLLYVFRHAKSSWAEPGMKDFDRPLANRGLKAAPRMAMLMRDRKIRPNLILCSTSRRTRETLGLVLPFLEGETRILLEDSIYEARSENDLLERLRRLPIGTKRVMVIGHNPIMQDLTLALGKSATTPDHLVSVKEKFPTAGLAVLDLGDTPWPAIAPDTATLTDFITPRALPN